MFTGVSFLFISVYVLIVPITWSGPVKDDVLSKDEVRDIEKFVGDIMGCANIPGLALTVIRGDTTYTSGHGVANMANGQPVGIHTLFNLGSTSKAFVPYVLAEIMNGRENHDGRITWNSTLKDILKHSHDSELPLTWADMTLKDTLIYKSGSSAADMSSMVGLPQNITREEMLRRLRFLRKTPEFRDTNHHSNFMYTVAGHLAERISGMSWAALVKSRVFDRLSMSSTFAPEGMAADDVAHAYRYHASKPGEQFLQQDLSLFNLHPSEPTGSIMASADDMAKWLRHILHNLNAKGNNTGINMLVTDAMHLWASLPSGHRESFLSDESEVFFGYGMGWISSTYRGQRRFTFSGNLYGFRSQIWLFPETFSAVYVATNGPGMEASQRAVDGIMYHISDIVHRKPTWVGTDSVCCCIENRDIDNEMFNDHNLKVQLMDEKLMSYMVPVERYIGTFGNGLVGNLNIALNETGILIAKIGRNLIGELTPTEVGTQLNFAAYGPLANTEEWLNEKTLEFSLKSERNEKDLFDKVRIYLKEHLFYEFQRGVLFETLLELAEENDRKQHDDAKILIQNDHGSRSTHFGHPSSKSLDIDGVADKEKDETNDESDNKNHSDNDSTSSTVGAKTRGGHTHLALNMDGHSDEPNLGKVKDPEANDETHNKDNSTSNTGDFSSRLVTPSILTLLVIIVHIISKV